MPKYDADKVNAIQSKKKLAEMPHMFQLSLVKMQIKDLS